MMITYRVGCRKLHVEALSDARERRVSRPQRYSGFAKSNRQPASHSDLWLP